MDENALVEAVAAGDIACFERLYALYERRIFLYARAFVRDAAIAEEVVIDTMLAVWDGAHRFGRAARVSTWILGIARHKALDAVRRTKGRGQHVALDAAAELATHEPGPDDLAQQRTLQAAMRSAFERLSIEHRDVLHLAFFEDLPYEHIARLLALPVNTVKTRVYYAKQKLKDAIEQNAVMEPTS